MKAITLTQPWATLVAMGAKRFETRSWGTAYFGPLLIHAAKKFPTECRRMAYDEEPFRNVLGMGSRIPMDKFGKVEENLPCGKVIAVTSLRFCVKIQFDLPGCGLAEVLDTQTELPFGDYTPGRYAWALGAVHEMEEPISCRGALGLWTVPSEVEAEVHKQLSERVLSGDVTL
jgi:hypothetical protein